MDLTTITADDFKGHFRRDFPYLPSYDDAGLYNQGDRVYLLSTKLFYDCLTNGTTGDTPPSANWEIAADDVDNYILEEDIEKAFSEAQILLNQALFSSEDNIRLGYYYLTAHYLVNDIQAALGGLESKGSFSATSRSVGNVSESYGIPSAYMDNPSLQFYTSSQYGLKYLSLVLPQLVGNIGSVRGGTQA